MSRQIDRLSIGLIALIVLIAGIATAFWTGALSLDQASAPSVPPPVAAPPIGTTVTIYDNSGAPALTFQTSDFSTSPQPQADSGHVRSWVTVATTNHNAAAVRISPNTMFGIIDTWGAYQGLEVVDANDVAASAASFDLAPDATATLRFRVDLPATASPDLLVFDRASHFAVLAALHEAIAGVGQTFATAAIPTTTTSWLAPQAGELTVSDLDPAASRTNRGIKIWKDDAQTAQVTIRFTNTQDGRIYWSPERVSLVDHLGQVYVAYPGPVNAASATPGATGSISPSLVPAHSTVQLTLQFDVPLGTQIAWVVISAGKAEYVIAAEPVGDANLAYANDQVTMLNAASGSCTPFADWSNRAHTALDQLDAVLTQDLNSMTAAQVHQAASDLRTAAGALTAGDTPDQAGFSESGWLAAIMNQIAETMDEAAANLTAQPGLSPVIDPTVIDDWVAMRDQFATRLTTLDGFVSTGCGDLFG